MFGGEAVFDSDNNDPCASCHLGTDIIMAFQPADDKAAAVQVKHERCFRLCLPACSACR